MSRLLLAFGWTALVAAPSFADDSTVSFRKLRLSDKYYAEGAGVGDFDGDGDADVVCGPYWWEGPDFTERRTMYEGTDFPNDRGYSDNFFSFVADFSGDGRDDVAVVGLPGTVCYWYENPGAVDQLWERRVAFPIVDNEAPSFWDMDGDGRRDIVFHFEGRLGWITPGENPNRPWAWTPISDPGDWQRFTHGLGAGDVDGDGDQDFLMPTGWWQNPGGEAGSTPWRHYPYAFCRGGAQIFVDDFDGDGDADVVSSEWAHGYGLSWWERSGPGESEFTPHRLMGETPEESPHGVCFSQLHALDLVDVNGDGLKDVLTGKTYWAHNGADPGANDPAAIYWFEHVRTADGVDFIPHLIDDDSGVGRQVLGVDVNSDGKTDVVTANKKGVFVLLQN